MRIQPFSIGPYGTISSVVYENSRCVIIDAPFPSDSIVDFIRSNNLEPEAVYLTHAHYDHIFGLPEMLAEYPSLQIYLSSDDFIFTDDDYSYTMSLLKMADRYFLSEIAEKEIERMPGKFIAYEDTAGSFSVLRTPGHTPGSVSLYSEKEKILSSQETPSSEEVSEGRISEVRMRISYHHSASCHVFLKTPLSSPVMAQQRQSVRKRETIHS